VTPPEPRERPQRPRRRAGLPGGLALLLAAAAVLDLYGLGRPGLFDQDEAQYAEIAAEIVARGDPVTLHANGRPWYVHPPLYMWLVAATGRVFGFSEWTVRVWSAAGSLLAVYGTVLLARACFGPPAGLLAGAVLAVTLQFLVQARLAVFDTVLVAWMVLAVYAFLRAYQTGERAHALRFFLFAGLATLTKGPIGLVLPALIAAAFVSLRRAWGRWREVPWGAGLGLYAAVGLSWYAAQVWLHGRAFVDANFGYYTLHRFFGVVEKHSAPWYFYLPVAVFGGLPWSAFWPAAAAQHLRRRRASDGSLLVLLGAAIPLAFYSAAQTKLPGYIVPVFPFAAAGVAALWAPLLAGQPLTPALRASLWALVLLVAALLGGAAAFLALQHPGPFHAARAVLAAPAALLGGGIAAGVLLALAGRVTAGFAALSAAMAVGWLAAVTAATPLVEAQQPLKPLAAAIRAAAQPGDRIVGYKMDIATSLVFYSGHEAEWAETEEVLERDVCAPGRVFLVITKARLGALHFTPPGRRFAERGDTVVLLKPAAATCPPGRAGRAAGPARHDPGAAGRPRRP
jgi:4-amino-4-deoxy-L-arabinose transferase-like glycosyltransferase